MALCTNCKKDISRYTVSAGKVWCSFCRRDPTRARLKSPFPYTTVHVDSTPITVTSLAHARRIEKEHGISFAALNYDEKKVRCAEEMAAEARKSTPPRPTIRDVMENPQRFDHGFGGHTGDSERDRGVVWPQRR